VCAAVRFPFLTSSSKRVFLILTIENSARTKKAFAPTRKRAASNLSITVNIEWLKYTPILSVKQKVYALPPA
jgi:hypothetical protein